MIKWNYREKAYRCGKFLYEYIYPVWQTGRRQGRRKKRKTTPEAQKKLNIRHTRERCARLMDANFTEEDISLTLTYAKNPDSMEQVKKDWNNFCRKLKRRYAKIGIDFKYLCVPEQSKAGRYHLHAVISGGLDRDEVEKLWGHGYANTHRLQPDETGLTALAQYITKSASIDTEDEQLSKKAFWRSKNLLDPPAKTNDSKIRSKKQAMELGSNELNAWGKLYPGYEAIQIERFHQDEYGHIYLFARLRLTEEKGDNHARHKGNAGRSAGSRRL